MSSLDNTGPEFVRKLQVAPTILNEAVRRDGTPFNMFVDVGIVVLIPWYDEHEPRRL